MAALLRAQSGLALLRQRLAIDPHAVERRLDHLLLVPGPGQQDIDGRSGRKIPEASPVLAAVGDLDAVRLQPPWIGVGVRDETSYS